MAVPIPRPPLDFAGSGQGIAATRTALGLGTGATRDVGAASGQLAANGAAATFQSITLGSNGCFLYDSGGGAFSMRAGVAGSYTYFTFAANGTLQALSGGASLSGNLSFSTDNARSVGTASARASVVYAGTGTINTSDAREKTAVAPLTEAETVAARDLAREIGTFRFLDAVAAKGEDAARRHIGLTVQRAIAILEAHGLDPLAYAFICHDAWEADPGRDAVPAREPIRDGDGTLVDPGSPEIPAIPGREAGDRYGFRADELLLFLARGFDARLSALEAR